jgi:hypothetical protein
MENSWCFINKPQHAGAFVLDDESINHLRVLSEFVTETLQVLRERRKECGWPI